MSCEETLEQFSACWEGLEDPRSGNAGLHDFYELLVVALCAVLCGGQGAFWQSERAFSAQLSQTGKRRAESRHLQPSVSQS